MEKHLLYQQIYDDVLQKILDGTYPPGSRIPSEKELSEQYGVSRITSKKAMEMLTDQGYLFRKPGKGSFVLGKTKDPEAVKGNWPEISEKREVKGLVGVIFDSFGPAFGSDILSGIENAAREHGYHIVLSCTYGSREQETERINELVELGAAGIILLPVQGEKYNDRILELSVNHFPLVLIDRELHGLPIPVVKTDNYHAAKDLVNILIEKGHESIAFFSHTYRMTTVVANRFSGYRDGMLEHGLITGEELWIRDLNSSIPHLEEVSGDPDGERIRGYVLGHPEVTGFFASNVQIGIAVYKVLKELGEEENKEVVFFDGVDESLDSNPIFTHVVQDEYMIGTMAVRCLREQIDTGECDMLNLVPYRVVRKG